MWTVFDVHSGPWRQVVCNITTEKRDAVERFHLAALCVWVNVVQVNRQPSAAHGH